MSTTQEDYFGDSIEQPRRRHRHRKHRSRADDDTDSDVSPTEVVHEEREYKKPGRKHRTREVVDTTYEAAPDKDSDVSSDDEARRQRRRRHRHRRKERIPDDDGTISNPDSSTDIDDRSTRRSGSPTGVRDRAKSVGESALAALGLEETFKNARSRSKSRGRQSSIDSDEGYESPSSRARSRTRMGSNSAQAAILAAAVEAFRARKEPGGLTGSPAMKRVVEAALASGAIEKFLGRNGKDEGRGNRHIAEAVLAGLAAQRTVNGPRKKSSKRDDDSNPLKALAASGLLAAAGKKALDYQRSRSHSRPRRRGDSSERPGLDRKRSRSVGEAMAALGLGGLAADRYSKDRRNRSDRSDRSDRNDRRRDSEAHALRDDDGNYDGTVGVVNTKPRRRSKRPGIRDDDSSSSDSLSDSDLELDEEGERKRHQMLRRKEIIGIALAIVATLHLGHAGYEAKEKRRDRKEMLESGKITEDEESKIKKKAFFSDAATVGLAVLAAAEAVKAWKEMNKRRKDCHQFESKHDRIEENRRRKALENGESSKYYSQPGYMGPPPGVPGTVPAYPYYPTTGQIPVTRGGDSYRTRDGGSVPVRHR